VAAASTASTRPGEPPADAVLRRHGFPRLGAAAGCRTVEGRWPPRSTLAIPGWHGLAVAGRTDTGVPRARAGRQRRGSASARRRPRAGRR
jgi:hypothetical protein